MPSSSSYGSLRHLGLLSISTAQLASQSKTCKTTIDVSPSTAQLASTIQPDMSIDEVPACSPQPKARTLD